MVYGILQYSNTDGDFTLVVAYSRESAGHRVFAVLPPFACQPPLCSDQSALKAIRSPCMFFLWVRQHIHILDRQLKASQSLSAREKLKKMTHLPKASHRHKLCGTRQIYSHLLLDHSSATDLRGSECVHYPGVACCGWLQEGFKAVKRAMRLPACGGNSCLTSKPTCSRGNSCLTSHLLCLRRKTTCSRNCLSSISAPLPCL